LHTDTVQNYFVENNIEVMVGDYTDYDDSITQVLSLYKRVGVPLYLYFEPGDSVTDAKILPQTMLSPDSLLDEIR
jgi:thiol:disulfide interchange protein